jgi:hypothetical protein
MDEGAVVVVEKILLTGEGAPGTRPLLEFLGAAAVYGGEQIWAEGDALRVEQRIYGAAQDLLAVREMTVRGRRIESWLTV